MEKPRTKQIIKKRINFHIDNLENLLGETELILTKEGREKAGDNYSLSQASC